MASTDVTPLRRPNGRLQACNPCRLRKVACDHTHPVCKRCLKRKQKTECVYITDESIGTRHSRAIVRRTELGSRESRPSSAPLTPEDESPLPATTNFGYLGATSYSCVFEETTRELDPVHGTHVSQLGLCDTQDGPRVRVIPAPQKEMCLSVLRRLPSLEEGLQLFNKKFLHCEESEWVRHAASRALEDLATIYKPYLQDLADEARLLELASILSYNTARPFKKLIRDPKLWMDQFLGPNLRWEALGLFYTFWELTEAEADAGRPLLGWNNIARHCLDYCINLCRQFSEGNVILLHLCYRRIVVESVAVGDASLSPWRGLGEAVTLLTFLGLHDEPDELNYQPCLASEIRRRLNASTCHLDKVLVSFTGRPPLLSQRFVTTPLPLDLADEVLLSDEETIARTVAALRPDGWDPNGSTRRTAFIRARRLISLVHGELLDCGLGAKAPSVELVMDLKQQALEAFDSIPASIKYAPENMTNRAIPFEVLYGQLVIQLEHLQSLFFAERMLGRCRQPNDGQLLCTSFAMVNYTLIFWTHQERLVSARSNLEWLVMAYAAPASGILCLELLRPSFQGAHPRDPALTRSAIIQSLSLLVGCLDQIQLTAPNGLLCANCKRIIQYVLDYRLNATTDNSLNLDAFDWNLPTQVEFDFDLLDTFDWMQEDIMPGRPM